MREDGLQYRHDSYPWLESGHCGQRVLNSSAGEKNPTLATANIITIKKWAVDITAKYIFVSLATVLRMFDVFIPWYVDVKSCVCMRTNTKTATSKGTDRWLNSRNGKIRKSGGALTKGEGEGNLKDCNVLGNLVNA